MTYDMNERYSARKKLDALKKEPLSERKENAAQFLSALKDPELIAQRIEWLLEGNYGHGQMLMARQSAEKGKGGNKNVEAQLNILVAGFEWQCPADLAIKAWKSLSASEKAKLDTAIKKVIKNYREDK